MKNVKGLLIVNEGPDGSGKETQTTLLCEHLRREKHAVCRMDFPTYESDPVAGCIRELLRDYKEYWNARPWKSKAVLYASNRVWLFGKVHEGFSERTVIVCNRYVPSNQAHMAAYEHDPLRWPSRYEWVERLEYDMMDLPRPDIVFLHTMPAGKRGALLARRERGKLDAHEADVAYLERVERCYQNLAEQEPHTWRHVPAAVGRIVQSPPAVHARLWAELMAHPAWVSFERARAEVRSRV